MLPLRGRGAIVIAKHKDSHSTTPEDKQINEYRYIQPSPLSNCSAAQTPPHQVVSCTLPPLEASDHSVACNPSLYQT